MNQNGQPRPERVKNGAGVAYRPKSRSSVSSEGIRNVARRLITAPAMGAKLAVFKGFATPVEADHGSLVQERWRPSNRRTQSAVSPAGTKESAFYLEVHAIPRDALYPSRV